MLHVKTHGVDAGIFQRFGGDTEEGSACVWIYVVHGQVDIGLGHDGASGHPGVRVFQKNKWLRVQIPTNSSPMTQLGIISCWDCPGGAEFYVQSASVTSYPIEEYCCQPE